MKKPVSPLKNLIRPLAVFMFLGAVLRILVSHVLGSIFMASQICDDVLMFSYAAVKSHFLELNHYALAKTMVYPLFLDIVCVIGLPYDICLSFLYITASLVLYFTLKRLFGKKWLAAFGYFYLLFIPLAFDAWCGLRIYRNAIVPPLVVILFSLMILLVYRAWYPEKQRKPGLFRSFLFAFLLGIVFTVNYYVREDGIWLLACLLVFLLGAFAGVLVRNRKKFRHFRYYISLLFLLIPLLVFTGGTHLYKRVNAHFFGVYEIETRTSGEQGEFTKKLFSIASENRSSVVWTPLDAISRAFDASETLRSIPGYREYILGYEENNPYHLTLTGERIQWIVKDALVATGAYRGEAESEAFFRQVNKELEEAFADGRLQKSDRIQLLSSSGGFTKEEILSLTREMWYGIRGCVLEKGYLIGAQSPNCDERRDAPEATAFAAKITNNDRLLDTETTSLSPLQEKINRCLPWLYRLFGILNALLFACGIPAALWGFLRLFRKGEKDLRREILSWLGLCAFLGIGIVYLFGISWYSHFIWGDGAVNTVVFNFYLIALPVIWLFYYLFTLEFFSRIFRIFREKRGLKTKPSCEKIEKTPLKEN